MSRIGFDVGTIALSKQAERQTDLFREPSGPTGFKYERDLISRDDERALIGGIAWLPLAEFRFQGFLAKRRVAYFGWRYDFDRSRVEPTEPIPDFLLELRSRAAEFAGLAVDDLPHALVTEYAPGVEIGWHRDRPVFEHVIGISLGSECTFRFRRKAASKWERFSLIAEPRSVYLMRGPSRWEWEHSIPAVQGLRYSVTFRSLRKPRPSSPRPARPV
jgi:alkylated DNA repair dioxygenase AlkB